MQKRPADPIHLEEILAEVSKRSHRCSALSLQRSDISLMSGGKKLLGIRGNPVIYELEI
jgi:hypothetical protein